MVTQASVKSPHTSGVTQKRQLVLSCKTCTSARGGEIKQPGNHGSTLSTGSAGSSTISCCPSVIPKPVPPTMRICLPLNTTDKGKLCCGFMRRYQRAAARRVRAAAGGAEGGGGAGGLAAAMAMGVTLARPAAEEGSSVDGLRDGAGAGAG